MGSLPKEQLNTLEWAYFSGYTRVDISEMLGLPLGTVKGRMCGGAQMSGIDHERFEECSG